MAANMKSVLGLMILLILGNSFGQEGESFPCGRDHPCVCSGHPEGDMLPDCNDCTGYYLCGNGVVHKKKCDPGQMFYGPSKSCEWGQCPSSDETCTGAAPETSSSTSSTTTWTIPTSPSTARTSYPSSTSTTRTIPGPVCNNTDVICRGPGQMLPNAEHCRYFYICQYNLCPALGFCEMGLWFDRDRFVCDYPKNVKNCPANRD